MVELKGISDGPDVDNCVVAGAAVDVVPDADVAMDVDAA